MTHAVKWSTQFEEFVESLMQEHEIPGLSVALAGPDEVIYARGFGLRDRETGAPAGSNTTYGMASITKSFAGLSVSMLEETGALSAMDPVVSHLPEFAVGGDPENRAMNIGHFMNHTSGLPPTGALRYSMVRSVEGDPVAEELKEVGAWDSWIDRPPIDDYDDLLEYLREEDPDLLGRPGEQFSYSNDAYALLGAVVERVADVPFEDFVAERVLRPLGMDDSTFSLDFLEARRDVTTLYAKGREGEIFRAPKWQDAPAMVAAGFLRSTPLDMVKYGGMYLRGGTDVAGRRLISDVGLRAMKGGVFPSARSQYYGRGFVVRPNYHGTTLIEHGGSLKGVSSHFGFVPERGVTASVVANLQGVPAAKIWLALVNLAMGLPIDTPRSVEPQYRVPQSQLERYVGQYRSGEGTNVKVFLEDGELFAEAEGKRYSLRPSGPDTVAIWYRGQEAGARFARSRREGQGPLLWLRIIPKVGV